MSSLSPEIARRHGKRDDIIALFQSRPLQWIGIHELAHVGGFAAWRTRVSEARQELEAKDGAVTWNEDCRNSAYMFTPYVPIPRSHDANGQRILFWGGVIGDAKRCLL